MKKALLRTLLVLSISWGTVWGANAMPIASTEQTFVKGLVAWWNGPHWWN